MIMDVSKYISVNETRTIIETNKFVLVYYGGGGNKNKLILYQDSIDETFVYNGLFYDVKNISFLVENVVISKDMCSFLKIFDANMCQYTKTKPIELIKRNVAYV